MKITERMKTEELKNFDEICMNCDVMKRALSKSDDNNNITLAEARAECASCNKIFKFDALYKIVEKTRKIPNRNVGKKATAYKKYAETVYNLSQEGKSIRKIAKIIGISTTTVQKILKEKRGSL